MEAVANWVLKTKYKKTKQKQKGVGGRGLCVEYGVVAGGGLGVVWFVWGEGFRGGSAVWMELVGGDGSVLRARCSGCWAHALL